MKKVQLLRQTFEALSNLQNRVTKATVNSSFRGEDQGKQDLLRYGSAITGALNYIRDVISRAGNLDAPRQYSWLRPIRRVKAMRASDNARILLEGLPEARLQELYDAASNISPDSLEDSLAPYANGVTGNAGQSMSDEDRVKLGPLKDLTSVLLGFENLRREYQTAA